MKVDLLYSTTYHSQTNDSFERTNQTFEIALRFHFQSIADFKNWSEKVVNSIQRAFNNSISFIEKTSNEICYEFISLQSIDLLKESSVQSIEITAIIKSFVVDVIAMIQMYSKSVYDSNHVSLQMKIEKWALLRFHKNYELSSIKILDRKLSQQYVEFLKIFEKINNLIYKLNIFKKWKIWSIVFIAQFESFSAFNADSFKRIRISFSSISMKKNTENVKFFEIERIIITRINRRWKRKYLVRWLKYESQNDFWRSIQELQSALNLVNEFNETNANDNVITFSTHRRSKRNLNLWYALTKSSMTSFFASSCYTNIL